MELTAAQQRVVDLVHAGRSVFFTGEAGTGKSLVLTRLVGELKAREDFGTAVAVTASTGLAASLIGGSTLHRTMGCGAAGRVADFLRMWDHAPRLRALRVLIVDEISMVSAELFQFLDAMLRQIREDDRPFGGLQLVLSGDFFQLPPVSSKPAAPGAFLNRGYAFQAPAWNTCGLECVLLTEVWRQRDPTFVSLLNRVRRGDDAATKGLVDLARDAPPSGIKPTLLFARNEDVDRVNAVELHRLPGSTWWARATDAVKLLAGDDARCAPGS